MENPAPEGPRPASFAARLSEGCLGAAEIRALAEVLVARHATAERAPDLAPDAAEHARAVACQADLLATSPRAGNAEVLAAVERARDFLETSADRLLARAGTGRILASALPLGLSDVSFAPDGRIEIGLPRAPAPPPCPDDAALELAQLAVSLRLRGRGDLAERLVSHYAGACEDFELYTVLDFYIDVCLVERFAAGALPEDPASSREDVPVMLITSGPVASGKSSLAQALADRLGAVRSVSDRIREHLVHGAPGRALHEAGWADGFEPGIARRIYAELLRRGELVLAAGRPIVLDASFPTRRERDAARAMARRFGVPFRFIQCRVDPDVQRRRLRERNRADGKDGAWETIANRFDEQFVEPDELDPAERITVDTSGSLEDSLRAALEALGRSRLLDEARVARAARPRARDTGRKSHASLRGARAVTFDCWRTLLVETDWNGAYALRVDALAEAAGSAGVASGREAVRRAFDDAWRAHMVAWTRGVATGAPEVASHALRTLGAEPEGDARERLIERWQHASHSGRVRAVDGAREALEVLHRAGIQCALVCDTGLTPGRVVRQLLEAQGLRRHLETCVFSDEVGVPKPDPAPFRSALEAVDVAPEESVHVGDLRRTDVAGARALGMATIRLRSVYDDPSPLPDADGVADSHEEVLRLLGVAR